jgi:hypothetical protein
MIWRRLTALLLPLAALILLAWVTRAQIAAKLAREYFRQHGISASVEIGDLGLSGLSGRFALGPAGAPDLSAARIELHFDPLSLLPRVVEVRLVDPVIRAHIDASGHVRLAALQDWLDSLTKEQGHSRFVSDDLAISLTGLRALLSTPGGDLELGGDAKLVRGVPIAATLRARPATLALQGQTVKLDAAQVNFDSGAHNLSANFSGSLQNSALAARGLQANLEATGFVWAQTQGRFSLSATQAHLQLHAASLAVGVTFGAPALELTASHPALSVSNDGLQGQADISGTAEGAMALPQLRTPDSVLTRLIAQNLSHLRVMLGAHIARQGGQTQLALTAPTIVTGAKGGSLRVNTLQGGLRRRPDGKACGGVARRRFAGDEIFLAQYCGAQRQLCRRRRRFGAFRLGRAARRGCDCSWTPVLAGGAIGICARLLLARNARRFSSRYQ